MAGDKSRFQIVEERTCNFIFRRKHVALYKAMISKDKDSNYQYITCEVFISCLQFSFIDFKCKVLFHVVNSAILYIRK